jgi:hypothetical protein
MEMTAGMRSTLYINGSFVKPYIQPRLHVNYLIDKVSILKFAYSRHNQFVKLINVGGSADPSNIWVPATEEVQPSASDIMELCYERKLGDEFSFSGSAYYKLLHNIIAVANFFDALNPQNDWQAFTTTGSGSGYGIELMFQKNRGNFTGWLSYVMSKSYREFPDLYTEKFLFDFDRTHMVKMYIAFEVDDHWSFGANYVLGSGQLFTVPIGKFLDSEGILQLQYGALNNFRSQPYNRFDISIIKTRVRGGLNQTWKLYVYNVSRTRNPYSITALFEDSSLSNLRLERAFLRIIPGISYVVKF